MRLLILWLLAVGSPLLAQTPADRFWVQHRPALVQRFGNVASEEDMRFLLRYVLNQRHTEVTENDYSRPRIPTLTQLMAQRRPEMPAATLQSGLIFPLLRYVLPRAQPIPSGKTPGDRMAATAHRYLGVRYGPPAYNPRTDAGTLDCSGLVNRIMADLGATYRRGAGSGATQQIVNSPDFLTVVGPPQPGDLLARKHRNTDWAHIGIYVGNGWLIDAPYRGSVVRLARYDATRWGRTLRYAKN